MLFRLVILILAAGVISTGVEKVYSQNYPNKPIQIVTGSIGGNVDVSARLISQGLAGSLGQQVIINNRAGAVIGGELVSKAPPDGHSLLVTGSSFWIGPLMRDNTPYDPLNDFSPITLIATAPAILVVHPSLPVKSVKELIALAKARPGELNYASAGAGGAPHLAAELFKFMTNTNIVGILYKSVAMQSADLLAGRTQLSFSNPGVAPLITAGKLRALAVTSAQRSTLFPSLPTIAASGVPGYESVGLTGMFAPAKTPVAITTRLNQEVVRVLNVPEVKEKFSKAGLETVGNSANELATIMHSEIARMGQVIKAAGIRDY